MFAWLCLAVIVYHTVVVRKVKGGCESSWTEVTSGVPQGSVLGPILFILYVNYLPEQVKSYCKIFVEDAKIYTTIESNEDFESIQNDKLDLCEWTSKWLMYCNVEKYKVMHIGKDNQCFEYKMTDKDGST